MGCCERACSSSVSYMLIMDRDSVFFVSFILKNVDSLIFKVVLEALCMAKTSVRQNKA